jgi:FMN phosphatase YigB (HAD superfamily)
VFLVHKVIDFSVWLGYILNMKTKGKQLMKNIIIFDLDMTVVDSSHRTPNKPDGTLDLQAYFCLRNRDSIMRDTLLPLAKAMRALFENNYIIIATARSVDAADYEFLEKNNLPYHKFFHRDWGSMEKDASLKLRQIKKFLNLRQFRGKPCYMFDDASPVIREMRKAGIRCLNSHKVNKRLANG